MTVMRWPLRANANARSEIIWIGCRVIGIEIGQTCPAEPGDRCKRPLTAWVGRAAAGGAEALRPLTTEATLTPNVSATVQQLAPARTAATTRSLR
jgi:hypothetical protein